MVQKQFSSLQPWPCSQSLFLTCPIVLFDILGIYMYLSITVKALLSKKYSQASEIFLWHIFSLMISPSDAMEVSFKGVW